MEYVQMTLNDWVEMKRKLRQELLGVKQSFVRIGYALRKIEDQKLYENDGYKSIAEFAKEEYGLEPSTTSRFMSINREYSIDGYSEQLRPEYADLGRSQLEEMLKLPESDRQMIQPETSREDIRELKRFNKTEPAAGVADDLRQLVEKFYYDNPEILNEVFSKPEYDEQTIKHFAEIVNPGGNRSYKKGLYFLMMYENRVAVKKFGADPRDLTWWDFWQITRNIFGEAAAGPKTWQSYFGGDEDEGTEQGGKESDPESGSGTGDGSDHIQQAPDDSGERQEGPAGQSSEPEGSGEPEEDGGADGKESADIEQETEKGAGRDYGAADESGAAEAEDDASGEESGEGDREETAGGRTAEPEGTESQGEKIAPAQKSPESLEREASDETEREGDPGAGDRKNAGQETTEAAGSGKEGTESGFEVMNAPEVIEKPFGSRKDWLDTLTACGMAKEMAMLMKTMLTENLADMTETTFWEHWLNEEVDENGKILE